MDKTPIQLELDEVESELLSYQQMRDGYKPHCKDWEVYDLVMRVLTKRHDSLMAKLPSERQFAETCFDAGKAYGSDTTTNIYTYRPLSKPDFETHFKQYTHE